MNDDSPYQLDGSAPVDAFPLTEVQESYYAARALNGAGSTQIHVEFDVDDLDIAKMEGAWNRLVSETDMLRVAVGNGGLQTVYRSVPVYRPELVDLSDRSESEQQAQLDRLREASRDHEFDPGVWPLFAIRVALLGGGRARFFFAVDELAVDGPSLAILLQQWYRRYRDDAPTGPLGITFHDYVLATRPTDQDIESALSYWKKKLVDAPLEQDAPFLAHPDGDARLRQRLRASIEREDWAVLVDAARKAKATPSALMLTLFTTAVEPDGLPLMLTTANRQPIHPDVRHLVGPFVSTSIFLAPGGDDSLRKRVQVVQRQLWRDLEHSAVSGARVRRQWAHQERSRSMRPLPVVFTSMLGTVGGETGLSDPGEWCKRVDPEATLTHTPGVLLEQVIEPTADAGISVSWDMAAGVLDTAAATAAFERLIGSLRRISKHGEAILDTRLSSLLHCGPEEAAPAQIDTGADLEGLPLTAMQTAYFAGRAFDPQGAGETRVYQEYLLPGQDVTKVEQVWNQIIAQHGALRGVVERDGTLTVRARVPRYVVTSHDLTGLPVAQIREHLNDVAEDMSGRPIQLGRWPMFAVEASLVPGGGTVLHLLVDAMVADARSIALFCGQLFAAYGGDQEAIGADDTARLVQHLSTEAARENGPEAAAAAEEWDQRFAMLAPGPSLPDTGRRTHLACEICDWHRVIEHAEGLGIPTDMLLLTAYVDALREVYAVPFTVVVVSWDRAEQMTDVVGDFTRLSWLVVDDTLPENGNERAQEIWARVRADLVRDSRCSGLSRLRGLVLRSDGALRTPVVFTRLVPVPPRLNIAIALARWSQSQTAQVALDAMAVVDGDTLRCQWDVSADALAAEPLRGIFDRYRDLIRRLTEQTEEPRDFSSKVADPPLANIDPLAERLERAMSAEPTAPAVRCEGIELNYAELDRRSAQLSNLLRAQGCRPGENVALFLERSVDLVVALLAVVRLGAVYVPVDPANPPERTLYLMKDSGATLVLANGPQVEQAEASGFQVVSPERDASAINAESDVSPWYQGDPEDPVYMIYTSGTTGQPKGCPNTRSGLANRLNWMQEAFPIGQGDRVLQKTPHSFDVSVWELIWPFLSGACLVVAAPRRHVDPAYIARVVRSEAISVIHFVPSMLALFLDAASARDCTSLRFVFASGEALPVSTMKRCLQVLPGVQLHNLYGPTEASIDVTHWPCQADWDEATVPIGHPITGISIHIVDDQLEELPPGTPGEICVSGVGVALGYYNQPELTQERFVQIPNGQRLYRTGDLGVLGADRQLRYLGRIDDQIKVRGIRVEPAEIERVLIERAGLVDARVFALSRGGDTDLAALCVATGQPPEVSELRRILTKVLPAGVVPNRYSFVSRLPLTANGKLDRAGALQLLAGPEVAPEDGRGPHNEGGCATAFPGRVDLNQAVTEIVLQVMDLPSVEPGANLFDLGATSFTVIRITQEVEQRIGRRVSVDIMIEAPSVAGIVAALGENELGALPSPDSERDAAQGIDTEGGRAREASSSDIRIAFDAAAKQAFKEARIAERKLPEALPRVALGEPPATEALNLFDASSFRDFDPAPLPAQALLELLARAAWGELQGRRKRLYASAGGFYPVQLYVYVRPNRVAGLSAGLYYLHPGERVLILLDGGIEIAGSTQVKYNQSLVEGAAFGLFMVSAPAAISPAYGQRLATRYSTLEAGEIAQLLTTAAPALGLGMCQVGEMNFEAMRDRFLLEDNQELLVSIWGGALTEHMRERRSEAAAASDTPKSRAVSDEIVKDCAGGGLVTAPGEPIAVVGFSALLPGADTPAPASSVTSFAHLLESSVSALGPVPAQRWSPLKTHSRRPGAEVGGYLKDVSSCEAEEFGLTKQEIAATDPQERLLLTTARWCFEDAGVVPNQPGFDQRVGVFVGAMWADHALYGVSARAHGSTGTYANRAGLAHRLSHAFGLTGPSMVIDSACVSGAAAFDAAMRALRAGQCSAALVGAANLVLHPDHLNVLTALGLLAKDPDSCPLTDQANGWIVGEGIGAALLKPLSKALADGDPIRAVLRGSAVQHAGRTRQFGLPSRACQEATMRSALADAGLRPQAVGYVEAAAAGAALGDSIEVQAVANVFGGSEVLMGSVKPVVGHLEAASIFAQMAKVICQLQTHNLYPVLRSSGATTVTTPSSVRLVTKPTVWPASTDESGRSQVRALINTVAGTGAYGTLVVEEPPIRPEERQDDVDEVLVFSADTPEHVAAYAEELAKELTAAASPAAARSALPLAAVARTLRTGRHVRGSRGVVVTSPAEAPHRLRMLADEIRFGRKPLVGEPPAVYAEAVRQWLAGAQPRWPVTAYGQRVGLPPVPLERLSVPSRRTPDLENRAQPSDLAATRAEEVPQQPAAKRAVDRRTSGPGVDATGPGADFLERIRVIIQEEADIDAALLTGEADLLSLGVNSRQLLRIAGEVRARGGNELSLSQLYEIENLTELAQVAFGSDQ